jgi:N-acetylmuramoyl-L-alanine amidase
LTPNEKPSLWVIIFLLLVGMAREGLSRDGETGQAPFINVVYPLEGAKIGARDSTFIFGQITPRSELTINGYHVKVHKNGAYLAFLPIEAGDFVFHLEARNRSGVTTTDLSVKVPESLTFPEDSLIIRDMLPWQDLTLSPGDILQVRFHGTPGCSAFFSIPGLRQKIPMVELPTPEVFSWGEVFRKREKGIEEKHSGVYSGVYRITKADSTDSVRIRFGLVREDSTWDSTEAVVTIEQYDVPRVVEFTGEKQVVRTGPQRGYLLLYQPPGVRAEATGQIGEWVRLSLAPGVGAWAHKDSIEFLPQGTPIPESRITYICTRKKDKGVQVRIPLRQRLPYNVEQSIDPQMLTLNIFGGVSDTDWIRYDSDDNIIDQIRWRQSQKRVYQIKVNLRQRKQWGYDIFYEENTLVLEIKKEPTFGGALKSSVSGLTFMIDPGHSHDSGAVGPTGLKEKDVNLWIAHKLRKILEKHGATVYMTRYGHEDVALYDRPKKAMEHKADILISIHNNALPDGVNPFVNNGTSSYYYHPQSYALAHAIHKRMVKNLGLADHGLYYGNLVLTRPTQMLAVLVECAFMMIPEQEAMLRTKGFQKRCAESIYQGICDFLKSESDH